MSCVAALFSPDAASFPTESTFLSFLLKDDNDSHKCRVYLQLLLMPCQYLAVAESFYSKVSSQLMVHSRSAIADDLRF